MHRITICIIAGLCLRGNALHQFPQRGLISVSDTGLHQHGPVLYYGNTPFNGTLFQCNAAGDTLLLDPYTDGLQNGLQTLFYPSGKIRESRLYVQGKREGIHRGWYADGMRRFAYQYHNDVFDGVFCEWYDNGNLYRQMHFVRGQEDGSEQIFEDDGTVYANYVVRNGRRYGLTGTKHCLSETGN